MNEGKGYFDIDERTRNLLFIESSLVIPTETVKRMYASFGHSNYYMLTYKQFHLLTWFTKSETLFHSMDDEFFNTLSIHKDKLFFYGYLQGDTFTPTEIVYNMPISRLGLFIRKKIVKNFKDKGIMLATMEKESKGELTRFTIL